MKLEHLQKRFEVPSLEPVEEDDLPPDADESYKLLIKSSNESIQRYKEILSQISDLENKIKNSNKKDENYKNLLLSAKEIHRLAYRELNIIENKRRGEFELVLRKLISILKELENELINYDETIKEAFEKNSPKIREKFGESGVRIYKLLLDNSGVPVIKIWFKSGRDFFKYWKVVNFIGKEKIIEFVYPPQKEEKVMVKPPQINLTKKDIVFNFISVIIFLMFLLFSLKIVSDIIRVCGYGFIWIILSIGVFFQGLILGIFIPIWIEEKYRKKKTISKKENGDSPINKSCN